jgi:hypothetical protein
MIVCGKNSEKVNKRQEEMTTNFNTVPFLRNLHCGGGGGQEQKAERKI